MHEDHTSRPQNKYGRKMIIGIFWFAYFNVYLRRISEKYVKIDFI